MRVDQKADEFEDHVDQRGEEDIALDYWVVAIEDPLDQVLADTRDREDHFNNDRAAEDRAEVAAGDRDERCGNALEGMDQNNAGLGQPPVTARG